MRGKTIFLLEEAEDGRIVLRIDDEPLHILDNRKEVLKKIKSSLDMFEIGEGEK